MLLLLPCVAKNLKELLAKLRASFYLSMWASYHAKPRDRIFKLLWSPRTDSKESIPPAFVARARTFKYLWGPGIDAKEWIPPAYVVCSLAGRYENPIPPRCLAPIDFLKIPAQAGRYYNPIPTRFLAPIDCLKIPSHVAAPPPPSAHCRFAAPLNNNPRKIPVRGKFAYLSSANQL